VSKVSGWHKAGVVVRVARDQAGRSRTFNAVMGAMRGTARTFGRVLHQLWLEVTGLIFLVMAVGFAAACVKEYGKYHAGQAAGSRLVAGLCCTIVFAWFGLSSFWRAGKKSQRS
jgi:hypothetical protein